MKSVLFLCTGNSCRSQMAEGFAKTYAPEGVKIYSAGTHPSGLNPTAAAVMREAGVDISGQHSKGPRETPMEEIDTVVTVCGDAAQRCPAFPGEVEKIHWPIPDPVRAAGSLEEVLDHFREVRDDIEKRVKELFSKVAP